MCLHFVISGFLAPLTIASGASHFRFRFRFSNLRLASLLPSDREKVEIEKNGQNGNGTPNRKCSLHDHRKRKRQHVENATFNFHFIHSIKGPSLKISIISPVIYYIDHTVLCNVGNKNLKVSWKFTFKAMILIITLNMVSETFLIINAMVTQLTKNAKENSPFLPFVNLGFFVNWISNIFYSDIFFK
jgi:hypothetical protein